jgi:hypothetical protein
MNNMNNIKNNNTGNNKKNKNNSNTNKTKKNNNLKLNNQNNEIDLMNETNNNVTKVESLTDENNRLNNNTLNQTKSMKTNMNTLCMNLLNHQIVLKLFHFQTDTYGSHKSSDKYIEKYSELMDTFLEVAQGIYGKVSLTRYSISGSSHTNETIFKHLNGMIIYFKNKIDDILGDHTELINLRDELLSDLEQLKYLLTFK